MYELGWQGPAPIAGTYEDPVDTYSDMGHLVELETWPRDAMQNIAYFCGVIEERPGETYQESMQRARVDTSLSWRANSTLCDMRPGVKCPRRVRTEASDAGGTKSESDIGVRAEMSDPEKAAGIIAKVPVCGQRMKQCPRWIERSG